MRYKGYEALGITRKEKQVLLKVRAGLEAGVFVHTAERRGSCRFNMGTSASTRRTAIKYKACGTVACIGGWMGMAMFNDTHMADSYVTGHRWDTDGHSGSLTPLFYPTGIAIAAWGRIKPAQAVEAIDRFLTGQEPWKHVEGTKGFPSVFTRVPR